jgi:sec-independent protein translocase protein TatA
MLAFFSTSGYEWVVVLIVALLLFGKRLPEVMRAMGQGIREFKKGLHEEPEDMDAAARLGTQKEAKKLPGSQSDSQSPPVG